MANGLETIGDRVNEIPEREDSWIKDRVESISKMLDERDQFPDILFDGRPYDEETAHLRLLQYHQDSIRRGFSDIGRQTLLDVAIEFSVATELPDDVTQANYLKASQEEQESRVIKVV